MSCNENQNCDCGCCAGTSVQTPQRRKQSSGTVGHRLSHGHWGTFKESMLARLSSSDYPALQGLKTRSDDDFTIALLDASSVMLDILTFYQERLANESYLRTATQLSSLDTTQPVDRLSAIARSFLQRLSRVHARHSAGLADDSNDNSDHHPRGKHVQSVPAQGQTAQYFETSADILGKPDWNALAVQTGIPWFAAGDVDVWLAGTSTQLQPGDAFLVTGGESPSADPWLLPYMIGTVTAVTPDVVNNRTLVQWNSLLGHKDATHGADPRSTLCVSRRRCSATTP